MIGRAPPPSAPRTQPDTDAGPSPARHGLAYQRLLKRADFVAAARGRRVSTALMTVQALMREETAPARVGLTVTKKVGTATERNRIKRRLRAAMALCADKTAPGVDYVIVGRRTILSAPFVSLMSDIDHAIRRLGPHPTAHPTPSSDRPR